MRTEKINLAAIQKKLSRDEMKKIKGGDDPVGCTNLYSCSRESEGLPCYGVAAGCTCKKDSNNDYMCLA